VPVYRHPADLPPPKTPEQEKEEVEQLIIINRQLIEEIFFLIQYGKFSFLDLWIMPVDIRKYITHLFIEYKQKEHEIYKRETEKGNIILPTEF
jgi:hypothetical protein